MKILALIFLAFTFPNLTWATVEYGQLRADPSLAGNNNYGGICSEQIVLSVGDMLEPIGYIGEYSGSLRLAIEVEGAQRPWSIERGSTSYGRFMNIPVGPCIIYFYQAGSHIDSPINNPPVLFYKITRATNPQPVSQ